jgi:hypothetical protein
VAVCGVEFSLDKIRFRLPTLPILLLDYCPRLLNPSTTFLSPPVVDPQKDLPPNVTDSEGAAAV